MTKQDDTRRRSRRDLLLILLILPFGILCMFMTGQVAVKLAPTWLLPSNMFSNLDPNADFAGLGNPLFIEPLNPAILTQPAWDKLFLTPNAIIPTRAVVVESTPVPPPRTPQPPPVVNTPEKPPPTATSAGPIIIPTRPIPQLADLAITKTDSSNTYTPGRPINYTIVVRNNGPDPAPRFNVSDDIPTVITGLVLNCAPASRCGTNTSSGNTISFSDAALYAGEQITITVSGSVASSATGNLSNTAQVTVPPRSGYSDPNLANNIVTDTDTRYAISDLAISKTNASNTYTADNPATNPITYTVVVTNSGPSDALGVRVVDNKPPQIESWNWGCTTVINASGCNSVTGSTSNFTDNGLNIQVGGRIEYTVIAYLPVNAYLNPSDIVNTARILLPGSPDFIDPNPSNNSSPVTTSPYIDLQITKTDSGAAYAPNGTIPYTVTVTNNSTFNLTNIVVSDLIPTQITNWTWTCPTVNPNPSCSGVTNSNADFTDAIDLTAALTAGASLTYNVSATVSGTPGLGGITNIADVSAPSGLVDANGSNNLASVTTPPYIDLQITKIGGEATYTAGGTVTYIITATNSSDFALSGITILDLKPDAINTWAWACLGTNLTCTPSTGPITSDFTDAIDLAAGEIIQYAVTATIIGAPGDIVLGNLVNTARIDVPAGFIDANNGNNESSYTHTPGTVSNINIGPPNDSWSTIGPPDGAFIEIVFNPAIMANGDVGTPDLIYYERYSDPVNQIVDFDLVLVEISSDGSTWYPVFYWGDGTADTNTNLNTNVILGTEIDNRQFEYPVDGILVNGRGVAIDIDNFLPAYGGYLLPGSYPYMRITSPPGNGDGSDVDAIEILP